MERNAPLLVELCGGIQIQRAQRRQFAQAILCHVLQVSVRPGIRHGKEYRAISSHENIFWARRGGSAGIQAYASADRRLLNRTRFRIVGRGFRGLYLLGIISEPLRRSAIHVTGCGQVNSPADKWRDRASMAIRFMMALPRIHGREMWVIETKAGGRVGVVCEVCRQYSRGTRDSAVCSNARAMHRFVRRC
jgi:hypothetical protein